MPYVHRSANGEIDSLHRAPTRDAAEFVDSADMDLQRFVSDQVGPSAFGRLDADFVRVLEDLLDVLLGNGMLQVTDLPVAAQAKLVIRKDWRERSGGLPVPGSFAASAFVEVIDDSAFGDPGRLRPSAQ
jgi:hypothetical protein